MIKTIEQLENLNGKKVLVRVDFNVPLKNGEIRDDNRIVQALPTIKYLLSHGARVILFSHLGKIKHKETPDVIAEQMKKNNMAPVAKRLGELLNLNVHFVDVTRGDKLIAGVNALKDGEVLLMQNTRYEKGEEKNDTELSSIWASLADIYVMDAFGSAHRAHASTYGVPEILKKEGKPVAMGYLVEKEVKNLNRCVFVDEKDRPYVAILGGLKVSDKIKVIDSLLKKCDKILIGGAMAYTFLKALEKNIGTSPCELDQLDYARRCYEGSRGRIVLPCDSVVTDKFEGWTEKLVTDGNNIPDGFEGMDIGPKTIDHFTKELSNAKMIFWNGPMGVFEQTDFQAGTRAICEAIAKLNNCFSVCGGGASAAVINEFGYPDEFSHDSPGGGASLEMIENDGKLPGIVILEE